MPIFDNYSFKDLEFTDKNISIKKSPGPVVITGECYSIVMESIIVITSFQKTEKDGTLHHYLLTRSP